MISSSLKELGLRTNWVRSNNLMSPYLLQEFCVAYFLLVSLLPSAFLSDSDPHLCKSKGLCKKDLHWKLFLQPNLNRYRSLDRESHKIGQISKN
jgi:hypothetical protein